jgi:membrane associated rhomboid family serine protease
MRRARWRDLSELPDSHGGWEAYYPLLGFGLDGKKRIQKHIQTTNILAPILISTPESQMKFLPPILVGDGEECGKKIMLDKKKIMYIVLAYLFLMTAVLFAAADPHTASIWFTLNLVMLAYSRYDQTVLSISISNIRVRAQFYAWMYCYGAKYIYVAIAFMLVIGVMQLIGIELLGSNERYLEQYALSYGAVEKDGEWWRMLTGPFLHTRVAHWMSNLFMGTAIYLLAGILLGYRSIFVFFSSAVFSFFAVYLSKSFLDLDSDGLVGVSGGMAGLIGCFLAINIRNRELFPKQFYVSTMFFVTITLLLVAFLTSITSFVCHISGLLFGFGLGFSFNLVSSSFLVDDQPPAHAGV